MASSRSSVPWSGPHPSTGSGRGPNANAAPHAELVEASDPLKNGFGDRLGRDPEMLVELGVGGRRTEAGHADEATLRPQPALPAEFDRRLDADARQRSQHGAAIALGLGCEQLP